MKPTLKQEKGSTGKYWVLTYKRRGYVVAYSFTYRHVFSNWRSALDYLETLYRIGMVVR